MSKDIITVPSFNNLPSCGDMLVDALSLMDNKRANGRFYTQQNPFNNAPFRDWAMRAGLPNNSILEPFAGGNNLIKMLQDVGLCKNFSSFDIVPGDKQVKKRNTLTNFPKNFTVCVTNPPWLARNSATRRNFSFPQTPYDDLYKYCLSKCLQHCDYVAALVPESFICADLFESRLCAFISLNSTMFADTEHPVGLALFVPEAANTVFYCGKKKMGKISKLKKYCPSPSSYKSGIYFNSTDGNLGLRALDNNSHASIRFCDVAELEGYVIKQSCRAITKIRVDGKPKIKQYNQFIDDFRKATGDVFLTAYRGLRKDGHYRRRLDYALARDIINHVGY